MSLTEADTCRKYVLPKLYAAGWNDDQITEQKTFTDGRIVVGGANRVARNRSDPTTSCATGPISPSRWLKPNPNHSPLRRSGDIVLAKTSFSTGAMCQWPGPRAVLNQNAVKLRAKDGMDQKFVFA